ncbi:hypothetical protein [Psychrosphaera algicola]|uniref:Uncharacterized protein n=1 Tax=Psychrosphaera algicola TaxID=3023714 RepID=A0ABT5FG71_9GAMM|nr:hypothetical protein [Psychrosphaera sp. G1-22]MDC2889642.1 hypothetical protein [Psychrosphaera sp. G1-22]
MKSLMVLQAACVILTIGLAGCDDTMVETSDTTDNDDTTTSEILHSAYSEFDTDNVDVVISGSNVIIETNGLPNHTSPYWSSSHELYVDPTVTTTQKWLPVILMILLAHIP